MGCSCALSQLPFRSPYFTTRLASNVRGAALERIDVLVLDKAGLLNKLEAKLSPSRDVLILKDHLRPAPRDFNFVLLDMPGPVKERDTLAGAGLVMSEFVLIPIEPNDSALNALPDTFDLIHLSAGHAEAGHGDGRDARLRQPERSVQHLLRPRAEGGSGVGAAVRGLRASA